MYKEVEGDLIKLALESNFDVIGHLIMSFTISTPYFF